MDSNVLQIILAKLDSLDNQVKSGLEKVEVKIDKIDARVDAIDITLVKQEASLTEHVKRCDMLEAHINQTKALIPQAITAEVEKVLWLKLKSIVVLVLKSVPFIVAAFSGSLGLKALSDLLLVWLGK